MLGSIISLALGAYLIGSGLSKQGKSNENRQNAKEEGKEFYYDNDHKLRSVVTNEICMDFVNSGGFRLIQGVKSNYIYKSVSEDNIKLENEWLKEHGYPYEWRVCLTLIYGALVVLYDLEKEKYFCVRDETRSIDDYDCETKRWQRVKRYKLVVYYYDYELCHDLNSCGCEIYKNPEEFKKYDYCLKHYCLYYFSHNPRSFNTPWDHFGGKL